MRRGNLGNTIFLVEYISRTILKMSNPGINGPISRLSVGVNNATALVEQQMVVLARAETPAAIEVVVDVATLDTLALFEPIFGIARTVEYINPDKIEIPIKYTPEFKSIDILR
jgi:hypothetical protein